MAPPVRDARVIAIDPGYRTGCKVTMLDETGKLLAYGTIYPTEPKKDIAGAKKSLTALVKKYKANVFVIGNGTASRETERFVSELIGELKQQGIAEELHYTIVNEAVFRSTPTRLTQSSTTLLSAPVSRVWLMSC